MAWSFAFATSRMDTEVDHLSRTFDLADPEVQTPKCSSYIAFDLSGTNWKLWSQKSPKTSKKCLRFLAFLINFEAFLFQFFSFVRLRSRSSYNAFELYRVRLTGTKMKLEIAKVFDLDGVRLKWSTSVPFWIAIQTPHFASESIFRCGNTSNDLLWDAIGTFFA